MESLLNRVNTEINELIEKEKLTATLQLVFDSKDSVGFTTAIGVYVSEEDNETHYATDVKAQYDFCYHFDIPVIFFGLDLKRGRVTLEWNTLQRLQDSSSLWKQTHHKLSTFVNAKMQSIANNTQGKFNSEWHTALNGGI